MKRRAPTTNVHRSSVEIRLPDQPGGPWKVVSDGAAVVSRRLFACFVAGATLQSTAGLRQLQRTIPPAFMNQLARGPTAHGTRGCAVHQLWSVLYWNKSSALPVMRVCMRDNSARSPCCPLTPRRPLPTSNHHRQARRQRAPARCMRYNLPRQHHLARTSGSSRMRGQGISQREFLVAATA